MSKKTENNKGKLLQECTILNVTLLFLN